MLLIFNMLFKRLQATFHPEQYHGWGKNRKFFEGWYYKVVNKSEDKAFAFIPGISMDEKGNQQAFVQVLDGKKLTSEYHPFNVQEFHAKPGKFEITIADNLFTGDSIRFNLPSLKGELHFHDRVKWPDKWYSPGIMGPYAFVPFMECYHGILSMDHTIEGNLIIHEETVDFTGGKGYMEKDWGHSFPSAYIWMQTNHFSQSGISLKVSVAKIPWLGSSFVGFIAGLWINDHLFEFTTYNSSHLIKSFAGKEKVELVIENRKYRLEILAKRHDSTELASPVLGFMEGRISESMTDEIDVLLFDKKSQKIIFHDTGRNASMEVAGKVNEIITGYNK
jgi:tocopherol cyclase